MKILFIVRADHPDYQSDAIMHGGRMLFGSDFVDCNRPWYMYRKDRDLYWKSRIPDNGKSFGRGFTLCGTLDEDTVDRTDIEKKIENKYFDLVIYGSVTRCFDHIQLVMKHYDKSKIVFVDGEDDQNIRTNLLGLGHVFKRELTPDVKGVFPINFSIPKEKIVNTVPTKTLDWATIVPGKLETYIYDEEGPYYKGYQDAMFALTHKKGGWDCLRHYEILMNGCIPYFPDLPHSPIGTMHRFPRELILESNRMIDSGEIQTDWYYTMANRLLNYTRDNLTSENVVKDILYNIN